MIRILLIFLVFITACGSNIAYGDYVDTTGWSRMQIESIKNHPKTQIGIASYYGKKFHKKVRKKNENVYLTRPFDRVEMLPFSSNNQIIIR